MPNPDAIVLVVDHDLSVREALGSLIRSAGLRVETFASAQEFLARPRADLPSCLVLDVRLPGLSGLDLQKRMAEANLEIPNYLYYRPWQCSGGGARKAVELTSGDLP